MIPKQIETASLSHLANLFKGLEPASLQQRQGFYRASFIGPWWLRITAMPSLALTGLPNWQGKKFIDENSAVNILQTRNGLIEKLQMQCQQQASLVDEKIAVALSYGEKSPLPWRWVVDELRVLDENTLLCMTTVNLPLLRHISIPFLLSRDL